MINVDFKKATEEAKEDILHRIDEFESVIEAGTSTPGQIMTMDELEKEWELLENFTHKKYSAMLSRYLGAVDERGIVELKKANTLPEESG